MGTDGGVMSDGSGWRGMSCRRRTVLDAVFESFARRRSKVEAQKRSAGEGETRIFWMDRTTERSFARVWRNQQGVRVEAVRFGRVRFCACVRQPFLRLCLCRANPGLCRSWEAPRDFQTVKAGEPSRSARHLNCTRTFNRSKGIWSISISGVSCETRIARASLLISEMGLTRASLENLRRGFFVGPREGLPFFQNQGQGQKGECHEQSDENA